MTQGRGDRTKSLFNVGFVNDNFPVLYTSHTGQLKGILNDVYTTFTQSQGLDLQWEKTDDYGNYFPNRTYSGLMEDIRRGDINASVERSYRADRIANFAWTVPVIYQSDAYITRTDIVAKFSLENVLVFSPFLIFMLTIAFCCGHFVEKVMRVLSYRIRHPSRFSFLHDLFSLHDPLVNVTSNNLMYTFALSTLLAHTFVRFIYNSAFTGSTVVGNSKQRDINDMISDIRASKSQLIIESPSFLSQEKMIEIYGYPTSFPGNHVIPDTEAFLQHLCDRIEDYGKVNSFFINTVDPEHKRKLNCDISVVPAGTNRSNATSFVRNAIVSEMPYTLLLSKTTRTKHLKKLNSIILKLYDFEKVQSFHWRRYTNRFLFVSPPKLIFEFHILRLPEISFLFYFLIVGLAVAFLVLCVEIGLLCSQFLAIQKAIRLTKVS